MKFREDFFKDFEKENMKKETNQFFKKRKIYLGLFSLIFIFVIACYIGNVIKFMRCDFKAPWKGEIIHAIGFVPGVSIITVWNDDK